jgi:hypothetical protein
VSGSGPGRWDDPRLAVALAAGIVVVVVLAVFLGNVLAGR